MIQDRLIFCLVVHDQFLRIRQVPVLALQSSGGTMDHSPS